MFKIFTILCLFAVISSIVSTSLDSEADVTSSDSGVKLTSDLEVVIPEEDVKLPRDKNFDCVGNWTTLCSRSKKMGKNGCPKKEQMDAFIREECQLNNLFSQQLMDCCTCYKFDQPGCAAAPKFPEFQ
ncbi:Protein CBG26600 [Caenorhabditis briggsae]|uniref:Uncharacterized protein n=2 Tax=Caenorhabditis briggsae TaxID=6238 RepID=A0AAE9J496_CAEBR|nr:Protein CBG26600 [Caenorhabditis briggsae]ULU13795.1 hypothetical protein L3Y34_016355 [Caenorhabditis briggsae]UMM14723.1 hypothetical protein L5515_002420 [Caenorhabditis briggsae]CAS00580.1 Protein CBG26600 [Caenorhabditis briggsae]